MVNDADGVINVKLTVKLVNYAVNLRSLVTVTPLFTIVVYGAIFEWRRMCTTLKPIRWLKTRCKKDGSHSASCGKTVPTDIRLHSPPRTWVLLIILQSTQQAAEYSVVWSKTRTTTSFCVIKEKRVWNQKKVLLAVFVLHRDKRVLNKSYVPLPAFVSHRNREFKTNITYQ